MHPIEPQPGPGPAPDDPREAADDAPLVAFSAAHEEHDLHGADEAIAEAHGGHDA